MRDVLIIAAQIDEQTGGLILDGLGGSIGGRGTYHEVKEAGKEMVEVVMPVGKHREVGEGEENLCEYLLVSSQPENTNCVKNEASCNNDALHCIAYAG